jgi:hypothetical protein
LLRTGSAGRRGLFACHGPSGLFLAVAAVLGFVAVVVASLREAAIVLFQGDCSQHIPSRGAAHSGREQLCRFSVLADADVSGANSSPPGPLHPKRRAASRGHCWPRPPHPRSASSWPQREGSQLANGNSDRTTGRILVPSPPLWFVQFDNPFGAPTITLTWAEGRATAGTDLSAVPGAKTEWGGTRPPHSVLAPKR